MFDPVSVLLGAKMLFNTVGSPRVSCVSPRFRLIAMPPNWFMPASNDTRVRVDAFSNTIASVRSRNGW